MNRAFENLLRLIDSGKDENIEMAIQLSAGIDFPYQYRWLQKYLIAKKKLPKQYPSWYAVYCEAIKYNSDRVHLAIPKQTVQPYPEQTCDIFEFRVDELYENVANELHFMMRGVNAHALIDDTRKADHALRTEEYKNTMPYPREDRTNLAIALAKNLLNLIRSKRDY